MPDDEALLERLRGAVRGFGALPGQRLTNGLLRSELERHVGGASHLPPQFRRKRGGQEHRITGQPSRAVLLAAWDAFISVPGNGANKFDPSSVYADWSLQGADRGRPAAASATGGAGGAVVASAPDAADGALAPSGQPSMEPWMKGLWVNLVDVKLARWKLLNAPSVLELLRHQREVAARDMSVPAKFREDVTHLMQAAVSILFVRRNRDELFNCMPAQIVAAMPDEFRHYGLLDGDHECGEACGRDGANPACHAVAREWARGAIHSRRMAVLKIRYETEGFRCALSPLDSRFWWWHAGPQLNELSRVHSRVAASLGIDGALFVEHIVSVMNDRDLAQVLEAVRTGVCLQVVKEGERAFPDHEPADDGAVAKPTKRRRSAEDCALLYARVEKVIDEGWLAEEGLTRLPRFDKEGTLAAYTDGARRFVARVSRFLHVHPREWAQLWGNVRGRKRRSRGGGDDTEDAEVQDDSQDAWDSYWSNRQELLEAEI